MASRPALRRTTRIAGGANLRLYPWFYFFHDLQVWMPIWIIFSTDYIGLNFSQLGLIGRFST